jgi:enoyl-[acyl-carrier protein] reductase I
MYPIDMSGRHALVMGVANHRSLAWAIAQCLDRAGARICLTYANDRLRGDVEELAKQLSTPALTLECDVTQDSQLAALASRLGQEFGSLEAFVHGIAFARREDLQGRFVDTPLEGFRTALEVSAISLVLSTRHLLPLLEKNGASIVTLTYLAAERAVPNYNVMGTAKAALEQCTRQLAFELGPQRIRVNAVSAGPVATLSARGITGFTGLQKAAAEKAPLKRNITKEEVGTAALFLLSDLGSGVTGETLYVDAGYHIVGT